MWLRVVSWKCEYVVLLRMIYSMSFLSTVDRGKFPRAIFCRDFLLMEACMNQRLTTRPPDLEVQGSSLARRVVYLDKELYSTLSSPRCMSGYRRHTGDGPASRPWGRGRGGNTPRHAAKETRISSSCLGFWLVFAFTFCLPYFCML